jgi:plastocyanin
MKCWNWQRTILAAVAAVVLVSAAGSAVAAGGKGPARASVLIVGSEAIKPNAYYRNTFRFEPGTSTIRSGGTVTLRNSTTDGHTLSIVNRGQAPRTLGQLERCAVCQAIAKSHGINPEGPPTVGPPPIPLVNVGPAGFGTPGDSVIVAPKGRGGPVTFKVTARPGTVLYYMCAIHPWMQGRFRVK